MNVILTIIKQMGFTTRDLYLLIKNQNIKQKFRK